MPAASRPATAPDTKAVHPQPDNGEGYPLLRRRATVGPGAMRLRGSSPRTNVRRNVSIISKGDRPGGQRSLVVDLSLAECRLLSEGHVYQHVVLRKEDLDAVARELEFSFDLVFAVKTLLLQKGQ